MNGPPQRTLFRPARRRARRLTHALLLAGGALGCQQGLPSADLVMVGGTILTMDPAQPRVEALAVRDGRIVFAGPGAGASRLAGPSTRVMNLEGRMVLPAFVDAHIHPVTGGMELTGCDLAEQRTAAEVLSRIAECAEALPDSAWLLGSSWDLPIFPDAAPRKEWLDSLLGDRPAYLSAADGHSAWVNSAALRLAGIGRETEDPRDGRIERDTLGEPTGTLRESAMALVSDIVPPPAAEQLVEGLRRTVALLQEQGVTAFLEARANRSLLTAYRHLDRLGELQATVVAALHAVPERGAAQVDSLVALRTEFSSAVLRPTAVKIFLDGVIEARTAAMLQPYSDRPGFAGEPGWGMEALDSLATRAVSAGFSLHFHAIGDRAIRMALDAIEAAERGRPREGRRHQITHLQVIDTADVARFHALSVTATFQPLWAYPDSYIRDLTWPALGPARSTRLYPIGDVHRAGGRLAFGSDWNVSSLAPLRGIQVAVTRRDPSDTTGAQLLPEQAIDLEAALRAYTAGSAWALGLEAAQGALMEGSMADIVVLERDLLVVPPSRIGETRVLLTFHEGRPVFGSLDSLSGR